MQRLAQAWANWKVRWRTPIAKSYWQVIKDDFKDTPLGVLWAVSCLFVILGVSAIVITVATGLAGHPNISVGIRAAISGILIISSLTVLLVVPHTLYTAIHSSQGKIRNALVEMAWPMTLVLLVLIPILVIFVARGN